MSADLTHSIFAENVNTKFRLQLDDSQSVEVELTEVTELRLSPRQEQFSILFRCPRRPMLEQKIYRLEHPVLGAFDLFLVPVGEKEDGLYCEAVFNRLLESGHF